MKPFVLDLSTVEPARPLIRVDGAVYELAVWGDFGLAQRTRLRQLQRRMLELTTALSADDAREDDARALVDTLDRIVAMVVRDLPSDVIARLDEEQKAAIVQAFTRATGMPGAGTARAPSPTSTGEPSFHVSSDSTAAAHPTG